MVTALKVSSTPARNSALSTAGAIGASVKMNDSIVPMSGAIMPAPLAMPQMVTAVRFIPTIAAAPFGNVSVVMIAFAAVCQSPGLASAARRSMTPANFVASSGSPITPVEARNTSAGWQPDALAAISAVSLVAARPDLPVNALALPELTTSALARPVPIRSRHQSTAADGHLDRVNTPDTVVPAPNSASSTSVRPG